jgi:hypothetical protein
VSEYCVTKRKDLKGGLCRALAFDVPKTFWKARLTATRAARRRLAASNSQQRKAVLASRENGSLDGVDFKRDILPKLQGLPVGAIADMIGASLQT